MTTHSFEFDATVDATIHASFEEEAYQDFSREDESREEYARRRALEDAARSLTMKFADDGVPASAIEAGECTHHDEW